LQLPSWLRASGPERLARSARLVLILLVEIVFIVALLVVIGRVVIPIFAPPVVVATPTPVT
jgi:hypothetical protein